MQIMTNSDTLIVMPAFNESENITDAIKDLRMFFANILVVDDGSSDNTREIALNNGCICIKHLFNAGQGAAVQTGIKYFTSNKNFKYVITFDADGQHRAEDADEMKREAEKYNLDAIIGSRFLNTATIEEIPQSKRIALRIAKIIENKLTGLSNSDVHVGLRLMSQKAAKSLNLKSFGMSHSTEILLQLSKKRIKVKEKSVLIRYNKYGQSPLNGINILLDLALNYLYLEQ